MFVAMIVVVQVLRTFVRAEWFKTSYERFEGDDSNTPITLTVLNLSPVSSSWERAKIPMILHQTAPADEGKWHHMWKGCQQSWFDNLGGFEYKMWTDDDLENLMQHRFKNFYPIWSAYPKNIHRIDVARYFILYEYGGIYADMDYECVQPFFSNLPEGKVCIAESAIPGEDFQNALMASPARHPFWHWVLNEVIPYQHIDDVLEATGPRVISRAIKSVPEAMVFALPHDKFAVQSAPQPSQEFKRSMRKDIFAIHHGSCVYC
jgi:mannosyltransferase OCH1-like enzyme